MSGNSDKPEILQVSQGHGDSDNSLEKGDAKGDNEQDTTGAASTRVTRFPSKLYQLLLDLEAYGMTDIVSFQPHGRAFRVYKIDVFVSRVLPIDFRQSKFVSFQRQLNIYGFQRITHGPDQHAYYHEKFLRGQPDLACTLPRLFCKGTGPRSPDVSFSEPNFYAMPALDMSGAASMRSSAPTRELNRQDELALHRQREDTAPRYDAPFDIAGPVTRVSGYRPTGCGSVEVNRCIVSIPALATPHATICASIPKVPLKREFDASANQEFDCLLPRKNEFRYTSAPADLVLNTRQARSHVGNAEVAPLDLLVYTASKRSKVAELECYTAEARPVLSPNQLTMIANCSVPRSQLGYQYPDVAHTLHPPDPFAFHSFLCRQANQSWLDNLALDMAKNQSAPPTMHRYRTRPVLERQIAGNGQHIGIHECGLLDVTAQNSSIGWNSGQPSLSFFAVASRYLADGPLLGFSPSWFTEQQREEPAIV